MNKATKASFRAAPMERGRRWKPLLLGMLVLTNVLYLGLGILLTPQSPDKIHLREGIILDHIIPDRDHTDSTPPAASASAHVRRLKCLGWRATRGCTPDGARLPEKDHPCTSKVPDGISGYCEVEDEDTHEVFAVMNRTCAKGKPGAVFRCIDAPGFFNFRAEAQQVINKAVSPGFELPGTNSSSHKQGIVMVVYPELVPSASATIRALREVLGCQLPIEIWSRPDEVRRAPGALDPLHALAGNDTTGGMTFREINDARAVRFGAKIYAIYHSHLEQVLFLDADNVPVRDPSYLFETPEFVKTGAVFWPDYWHPQNTIFFLTELSLVWQLLDMPFVDMFEQESGQLLINRRQHAAPMELVAFYAKHRPDYFSLLRLAWGDKDLFRFAWLKLGAPFHMIETPPSVAGKLFGNAFCGMTMVAHDPDGEVIFLHRNQMKLTGKPKIGTSPGNSPNGADDYPDPAMWTHLLSFRSSSPRSKYVIQSHRESRFSDKRRCFGRSEMDRNPNFYAQKFAELSFAGLETQLRRFAMEAAQFPKTLILAEERGSDLDNILLT
ncbi:hypothetical protein PHYPSEUDO_005795 [Phytophthora pseudosyringae]|uniref:Nucleotide-diphospho-sugar transferase n=1 Tax=Phytophthora pseudosyringae TaxID=221518 RepID=A0A8T1VK42_9STRA|nr:hypothetical protein PHYPSEUDO_005795 [Phytophthora pseudosyringae]